jgi:hypothetical protein
MYVLIGASSLSVFSVDIKENHMIRHRKCGRGLTLCAAILAIAALPLVGKLRASDHADTADIFNRIGGDMTDVFIFPSPTDPNNVVLVLDAHGLIPGGMQGISFDPGVLYQFKIDNNGDFVEDLVIQVKFGSPGPHQTVYVAGPHKPLVTGTKAIFSDASRGIGTINETFQPVAGMQVFAGLRADPFFFDVGQLFNIFPDRKTPLSGKQVNFTSIEAADTPQQPGFLPPGQASDFLAGLNCLSIVIELPRASLAPPHRPPGVIRLWETTSVSHDRSGEMFSQFDRLARPAVNELLATVTDRRHEHNDHDSPIDDKAGNGLISDIKKFLAFPANRSAAISRVIESVLVPDVMIADLSQTDDASYLGFEVAQALSRGTRSSFGGRALTDDVIDISLGIIFGDTIPMLGLAPDDGKELPSFTTDNVGYEQSVKHTLGTFPFVGTPN